MRRTLAATLMAASLVLAPVLARADLDKPGTVPTGLSAQATLSLLQTRARLMLRFDALNRDMALQRAACAQVRDDDTAKIGQCQAEAARLRREIAAYRADVATYEASLVTAAKTPLVERQWRSLQSFVLPAVQVEQGEAVFVLRSGRRINARDAAGQAIDNGTVILMSPGARMSVLLPNETMFSMSATSEGGYITFDTFIYDPESSTSAFTARLTKGVFRFVTGKIAQPRPEPRIDVPIGDLGFRGTDAEAEVRADGSGVVRVRSGSAVFTFKGGGAPIELTAGQSLEFTAAGQLVVPRPIR